MPAAKLVLWLRDVLGGALRTRAANLKVKHIYKLIFPLLQTTVYKHGRLCPILCFIVNLTSICFL